MKKINYKKHLGQNFLVNQNAIDEIKNELNLSKEKIICEIGGGSGNISKSIAYTNLYKQYYIFEIDPDFIKILAKEFATNEKIQLIDENILRYDLNILDADIYFGAIPYYITSPIVHKLLSLNKKPESIILIVQKEVADKMLAVTPKATYWSYITTGYKKIKLGTLKTKDFKPSPKVDSTIIKLEYNPGEFSKISFIEFDRWRKFVRWVFINPRKMLNKTFKKELLIKNNIDPTLRPQNLELKDIINLYSSIYT